MSGQVIKEQAAPVAPLQRKMILSESSPFMLQEAYKTLRTNLLFALRGEGCKRFCITSSMPGEGKSITILNLAISIAQTGKRVLLIDADLRRPALARLLAVNPAPGLSNVLADQTTLSEAIRAETYPNLDVMLSGDVPPNPSELLSSEQMVKLVGDVSRKYDYVLVDAPPVNLVSDCCIVANMLDGIVLLARQGKARKDGVKQAINQLRLTECKVLGCVFNGVAVNPKKYYRYN
ncbi:MAG: CpsD/CapB family tyrosine-protein kinase [Oscillospiraceae bacterium]|nr:CpsD/CapB family tyrosine-protein kinase [Oscillospiraceae bacterium]